MLSAAYAESRHREVVYGHPSVPRESQWITVHPCEYGHAVPLALWPAAPVGSISQRTLYANGHGTAQERIRANEYLLHERGVEVADG